MEKLDPTWQEQNHLPNTWEKNKHGLAPILSLPACPSSIVSEKCVPPPVRSQTPGKGLRCKGNQIIVLSYRHLKKQQQNQNKQTPTTTHARRMWRSLSSFFLEAGGNISIPPTPPPGKRSSLCWKESDSVILKSRKSRMREFCTNRHCST